VIRLIDEIANFGILFEFSSALHLRRRRTHTLTVTAIYIYIYIFGWTAVAPLAVSEITSEKIKYTDYTQEKFPLHESPR